LSAESFIHEKEGQWLVVNDNIKLLSIQKVVAMFD